MKNEKYINAIGKIDDDMIIKAHSDRRDRIKKKSNKLYALVFAIIVCLILLFILCIMVT